MRKTRAEHNCRVKHHDFPGTNSLRIPVESEHAERRFRKKVVKTLGVAVTDFRHEKLKTKVKGTPVRGWVSDFSCAYSGVGV